MTLLKRFNCVTGAGHQTVFSLFPTAWPEYLLFTHLCWYFSYTPPHTHPHTRRVPHLTGPRVQLIGRIVVVLKCIVSTDLCWQVLGVMEIESDGRWNLVGETMSLVDVIRWAVAASSWCCGLLRTSVRLNPVDTKKVNKFGLMCLVLVYFSPNCKIFVYTVTHKTSGFLTKYHAGPQ